MTPVFHALGLVCALGAVIFAASGKRGIGGLVGLAAGFSATVFWANPDRLPDATWIGTITATVAGWSLVGPGTGRGRGYAPTVVAGVLAGFWSILLRVEGLPPALAVALATAVAVLATILAWRHPEFAPRVIQEEGLLLLMVLSVMVAAGPQVIAGWQSAGSLNASVQDGVHRSMPMWVILLGGGSVALGGMYSLWRSR